MLDEEAIEEFRKLYWQEFGIKLSAEQATYLGTKLVSMVRVVYGDDLPKLNAEQSLTDKNARR